MNNTTQSDTDTRVSAIPLQDYKSDTGPPRTSKKTIRTLKASIICLSALTIASLGIACAGLIIAVIATKHVPGRSNFVSDMERIFNCSVYAVAEQGFTCWGDTVTITGQTALPGQCVSVTESSMLHVSALAKGCNVYAWFDNNCTGSFNVAMTGNDRLPQCATAPGLGLDPLHGNWGNFSSFQVLCYNYMDFLPI